MAILNIRRLPDNVHARLRLRAAGNGRSMEAEARDILARACDAGYRAGEGSGQVRDGADPAGSTLAIDLEPRLAEAARDYARRHRTTVQGLILQLLDRELVADADAWCDRLYALMDEAGGDLEGQTWSRDELYRV